MPSQPDPKTVDFDQIKEGDERKHVYPMTRAVYDGFLQVSRDRNPLHTEDDFARSKGFREKVMHGGILNAFLSHFVGMIFPGTNSVLLSSEIQYASPCYLEDDIELSMRVDQKTGTTRTVVLHVRFNNLTQKAVAGRGKVMVKVQ
jgi:3-hydroxybutyryl-CoA dehydratase